MKHTQISSFLAFSQRLAVWLRNWEWLSQSLSRTLGDQFSHQLQQLQLDRPLLDLSQLARSLHQERGDFQATDGVSKFFLKVEDGKGRMEGRMVKGHG